MKFKLKQKEAQKRLLIDLIQLLGLIYFINLYFKDKVISDKVKYTLYSIILLKFIFTTIRTYLKLKKMTILELSDNNLKYHYIRKIINKESILKIDLIHGHTSSFALIIMKDKPKFKFYQLRYKYYYYIHGTPYLINLDKIEGEVSSIYQKLLEWKSNLESL